MVSLPGGPAIEQFAPHPPDVYLDTALLCFLARERPWTPEEWLGQSAMFLEAYRFLLPVISELVADLQKPEEWPDARA